MQKKPPLIEENLINELDDLIASIKTVKNNISDEDIAVALGYNEGYISQVRSRGKAPLKFVSKVKDYLERLQNANQQSNINSNETGFEQNEKNITIYDLRDLVTSNKTLADANKELAIANRKLVDDHSELVQLAKQAFNISLEKLGQVLSVPVQQDVASSQKVYEDLPLGTGHVVKKKHSPFS